ncbi:uncharacterized protein LOC110697755 [Chenopodium quinoa]|uniref:uncharacterized protein LOC110697755 n=1 Tax=Chenopodium quinoa TaxID=63459 RepID=UPI000B7725A2|nr:uncharacterized protein LOC110697755 [Chenopodium quinoa]
MSKMGGFFVCLLVIALDIAAGLCGLEAEIAQNKAKHLKMWIFECKSPSEQAFKLGAAAAGLLILAHVISSLLGGCMCLCSREDQHKSYANRQLTTGCFLLTWLILVIGLSLLVIGTLANRKDRASCGITHHHMLSIGSILCFIHALFSTAYYLSATSSSH